MNVWLVHIGEDIAIDDGGRMYRYGYLADAVKRRGGGVLRWAPTFRHTTKTQRADSDQAIRVSDGYDIQLVHAPGYRAHVSLRRVRMHQILALRFRELAPTWPRPDIIVAAIPSLEWASAAIEFGGQVGAPVVVDVRDVWPDVFESLAPRPFRPLARLALTRYSNLADDLCRRADALTGVSPSYLDWALQRARRAPRDVDQVTPIGCVAHGAGTEKLQQVADRLVAAGFDPRRPTGCYLGQFARSSDVETVIDAARRLQADGAGLQLLLCGDGAKRKALERRADGIDGIHFLGWADGPTLAAVMRHSQFGLCSYHRQATQSWPNKPFEYMAGGLAIVSSLAGDLETLVSDEQIGVNYRAGDPDSLAIKLRSLISDAPRLEKFRENAVSLWHSRFRPESIYDDFANRLEQVARTSARAA